MVSIASKIKQSLKTRRAVSPVKEHTSLVDMSQVAVVVLSGGEGTRLAPLTKTRCKPALSFGGKYRLIDVPMSNAINSGCFKIYIITQFLSTTLHQHIFKAYHLGTCSPGFIELLTAEQRPSKKIWFQGTADAVRQNLEYLSETPAEYFLILSGDQLYNMNFRGMLQVAQETDADMVIASLPIAEKEARRMGLLKLNEDRFITEFCEKPQDPEILRHMEMADFTKRQFSSNAGDQKKYLGSMGIYLFKRKALFDLLREDEREDFGKHLIPTMVNRGRVAAHLHEGYWEDIGTIDSFYHANIDLTSPKPAFDCNDENFPIFSLNYNLPGPKINNCIVKNSIICDGCHVHADEVSNSILGLRSVVGTGSIIRNSYLIGNDFYHPGTYKEELPATLEIGENCIIDKAIIDKHVHIGRGVQLINKQNLKEYSSENVCIRDGIIVVTRGASIPDGFVL